MKMTTHWTRARQLQEKRNLERQLFDGRYKPKRETSRKRRRSRRRGEESLSVGEVWFNYQEEIEDEL